MPPKRGTVAFLGSVGKEMRDKLGLDKYGNEKGVEVGYDSANNSDASPRSAKPRKKKASGRISARDRSPARGAKSSRSRASNR